MSWISSNSDAWNELIWWSPAENVIGMNVLRYSFTLESKIGGSITPSYWRIVPTGTKPTSQCFSSDGSVCNGRRRWALWSWRFSIDRRGRNGHLSKWFTQVKFYVKCPLFVHCACRIPRTQNPVVLLLDLITSNPRTWANSRHQNES